MRMSNRIHDDFRDDNDRGMQLLPNLLVFLVLSSL
jgi:hypothetical protein